VSLTQLIETLYNIDIGTHW